MTMSPRPLARRAPARAGLVGLACALLLTAATTAGPATATTSRAPATATAASAASAASAAGKRRPNILLVFADDMRLDEMRYLPKTRRLIGRQGTTFTQAVSENPVCCPARTTLLTGRYTHNSGVMGNRTEEHGGYAYFPRRRNIPVTLRRNGYNTSYIGKFLNGYPGTRGRHDVPPGWTHWRAPSLAAYNYNRVQMNQNGRLRWHKGYRTNLYARWSNRNLKQLAGQRKPFFLTVSHLAPHVGALNGNWVPPQPAPRYRGSLIGKMPGITSPALNEADVSDKPDWIRNARRKNVRKLRKLQRMRAESLRSVDDAVAGNIRVLRRAGVLKNTIVVFASDNGFMLGEHRVKDKRVPYEESVRVPLLVRGPGFGAGRRDNRVTGLVDVGTTFAKAARVARKLRYPLDGRSLLSKAAPNRAMLLETGPRLVNGAFADGKRRSYVAARSRDGLLVRYWNGENELYDLRSDPHQLDSVFGSPDHAALRERLGSRLDRLDDCVGAPCRY